MNRLITQWTLFTLGMSLCLFCQAAGAPGMDVPAQAINNTGAAMKAASMPTSVMVGGTLDDMRVFPNPWRADKHAGKVITFDHLPPGATIKLFTVAGQFIKILEADESGSASWDLANDSSVKVASGVYFYLVSTEDGQDIKGKLAIIK